MTSRTDILVVTLVVAAAALVFAPVVHHAFVDYDDGLFVYANPHVLGGWSRDGLAYAFSSWEHRLWAPLTWLSHMTDVQLFGVEGATLGLPASGWHHATNLVLHLACSALLYALLRSATGARWRSGLVAALFALHPLHVESVAWISERKTLLSTLCGLGSLLAYVRWARRPSAGRLLFSLALLAAGLMSKPMLVTWPFLMLLLDLWPLGRLDRASASRRLLEKWPAFALVAASSVATVLAQRPAMQLMDVVPLGYRLQNAVVSCFLYVVKLLWPAPLAALYPYRASLPAGQTLAAIACVALATIVACRSVARRPYATFGWFWFLGTLVPVSGLVQVGNHAMADRYTYVPLIGLFVVVAWGAAELAGRRPVLRQPLIAASLLALGGCAAASARQVGVWSDTETLFRHTCAATEPNGEAHHYLGRALAAQGRADEAAAEYRAALAALPRFVDARVALGVALAEQGRHEEAVREWRQALGVEPGNGAVHGDVAASLLALGRTEEAIGEYRLAIASRPDDAALRNNLASALALAGRFAEAIEQYQQAARLAPDLAAPRLYLGRALAASGRIDEALAAFEDAARIEPGNAEVLMDLAQACADSGRIERAIATAEEARRLAGASGSGELESELSRRLEAYRRVSPELTPR